MELLTVLYPKTGFSGIAVSNRNQFQIRLSDRVPWNKTSTTMFCLKRFEPFLAELAKEYNFYRSPYMCLHVDMNGIMGSKSKFTKKLLNSVQWHVCYM